MEADLARPLAPLEAGAATLAADCAYACASPLTSTCCPLPAARPSIAAVEPERPAPLSGCHLAREGATGAWEERQQAELSPFAVGKRMGLFVCLPRLKLQIQIQVQLRLKRPRRLEASRCLI